MVPYVEIKKLPPAPKQRIVCPLKSHLGLTGLFSSGGFILLYSCFVVNQAAKIQ